MADDELICMIEIPKGSRNKYEYDPELKAIKFDRFVSASVVYPADYGFIPETLGLDGDELDVLVCVSEPTFPGCRVPVRPIGLLCMTDENGQDDKVVCVPTSDPRWNVYEQLEELPEQLRDEIFHFFSVYKDLDPDRHSEPRGWGDRDAADRGIADARRRFREQGREPRAVTAVYHVELRQFPHAPACSTSSAPSSRPVSCVPWVKGEMIDHEERRWAAGTHEAEGPARDGGAARRTRPRPRLGPGHQGKRGRDRGGGRRGPARRPGTA